MADETEELNLSFHELNLEDEASSAPNSRRSLFHEKHDLTPDSKHQGLPKSKARRTSKGDTLHQSLKDACIEDEGSSVKQEELVEILRIGDDLSAKSRLSRAVASIFPRSTKKRVLVNNKQITIYTNLKMKQEIELAMAFGNNVADNTKKEIRELEDNMLSVWEEIQVALEEENKRLAQTMMLRYRNLNIARENHVTALVNFYEKELTRMQDTAQTISTSQKEAITKEMETLKTKCNLGYRNGLMEEETEIPINIFSSLAISIAEECPIINDILKILIGAKEKDANKLKTHDFKMRCVGHALSGLVTLANQKYPNDIQLFFGVLCLSYGGGKQFINMLNAIGLSLHWDTLMKHLDERLDNFQNIVDKKFPKSWPVLLLLDNINMYKGNKRHYRLFKTLGPKMWNFTGRGAILPNLDGIENLLQCQSTAVEPQIDYECLEADNILLDNMETHKQLWSDVKNAYNLKLLKLALNLPTPPKPFKEMDEPEFSSWLSSINFEELDKLPRTVQIEETTLASLLCVRTTVKKTETLILPLSLENNSTLPGTASIIEEFGKEFHLPCVHKAEMLEFDEINHKFDLKGARTHFEFLKILHLHRDEMALLEMQMQDTSKQLEASELEGNDDDENSDDDSGVLERENSDEDDLSNTRVGSSAAHVKEKYFEKEDDVFKRVCNKLRNLIWNAVHSSSSETALDHLISQMSTDRWWDNKTDHFDRTILHYAVESNNQTMVRVLLAAGVNPNAKEGCGLSPLHLAVIGKSTEMCKILVDGFALINGLSFSSIPSPYEMANAMKLTEILNLFEMKIRDLETINGQLSFLASEGDNAEESIEEEIEEDGEGNENEFTYRYERSQFCGFPTGLVGDQGTCKNNRSVKQKDQSAFGWVTEIPGDLHAKGHLCEATFKAQGRGGFHYLITNVLKRKKLTEEAFRKKKFQDQNLQNIKEAVRDASVAYGMAAVMEFKASKHFPSKESLKKCLKKHGNHNKELLDSFNTFMKECSNDVNFTYHSEMFSLFGPLLQLFNDATRFGNGLARETVWVLMLPIFAQLQFRNYWTETIVHVVNFVAVWPLAFREMIKNNSTVNLSGKEGADIDLDEFVETYIVRPLKQYASGHSSVKTCQRIMANVQFIGNVRRAYADKQAFDVHPTTKHTEQSPFPDQIKGMWFCLREGFFEFQEGREDVVNSFQADSKPVPNAFVSVYDKGIKKVKNNFFRKLHECFPSMRKLTFKRTVDTLEQDEESNV